MRTWERIQGALRGVEVNCEFSSWYLNSTRKGLALFLNSFLFLDCVLSMTPFWDRLPRSQLPKFYIYLV